MCACLYVWVCICVSEGKGTGDWRTSLFAAVHVDKLLQALKLAAPGGHALLGAIHVALGPQRAPAVAAAAVGRGKVPGQVGLEISHAARQCPAIQHKGVNVALFIYTHTERERETRAHTQAQANTQRHTPRHVREKEKGIPWGRYKCRCGPRGCVCMEGRSCLWECVCVCVCLQWRTSHVGQGRRGGTAAHPHHFALFSNKVVHFQHVGLLGAKVNQIGQILSQCRGGKRDRQTDRESE
jgi:hypothetical protein